MKYISVCSGIEAATVAWRPLGWEAVAFAEIEPFPNAVLEHHYPDVPNLGDITKVDWRKYAGMVDLVVGGTPCQSFSVAGKREGLDGASGPLYSRPGNERVETEALVVEPSVTPPITTKWAREGWTAYDETAPLMFKIRQGCDGGGKGYLGSEEKAFTLSCNQDQQCFAGYAVRRLTPTECERLQGFPDGYTDIEFNGKPAPDGARYKALGNSMAVPCMKWIGERIQMMESYK